jgi:hypothetical protein
MNWIKSLLNDWLQFLKNNEIQEALIFLTYIVVLKIFDIIPIESFNMLAGLIIGGDALKKLGAKK